jgi:FixJ family two-component response regulator
MQELRKVVLQGSSVMNLIRTTSGHRPTQVDLPTVFVLHGDADVTEPLQLLSSSAMCRIKQVESAEAFLASPRASMPACVLTELRLPGSSGLDLQQQILDRRELPVIFVSTDPDTHSTVQAMKHGAFDVLAKPCPTEVLLQTVLDALENSRVALHQLAHEQALQQRYESLSRREREVMGLVVTGRLNKQVGADLGISEITVKAHRGKMMLKMQAASFAELVNMAACLRV